MLSIGPVTDAQIVKMDSNVLIRQVCKRDIFSGTSAVSALYTARLATRVQQTLVIKQLWRGCGGIFMILVLSMCVWI